MLSSMTSGKLRRLSGAKLVLPIYTHPLTHSAKGLYANCSDLGSSLRSTLSSFSFCNSLPTCTSCICKLCSPICHLSLPNCISCSCKLCSWLYLANYHLATIYVSCKLSTYKLYPIYLANCHLSTVSISCKLSTCNLSSCKLYLVLLVLGHEIQTHCSWSESRLEELFFG